MQLLDKVHIENVQPGMVIMKLDKPGIHFAGFGKPVVNLSVLSELEKAGVKFVYVKSDRESDQVERDFYESSIQSAKEGLKAISDSEILEEPVEKNEVFVARDRENMDFQQLTVANNMLDAMLERASSAFGDFFQKNGVTNTVDVEMMAKVVHDTVAITRSTPELFAKIISSEGMSTDERVHSTHVCIHSTMLAHALGIDGAEILDISFAGLIHDIGLSKLPKNIAEATGTLSEYEHSIYKKHPILGEEICASHPMVNDNVTKIVAMHHECIDGSGYPGKVSAPYIPRGALIVGIAEAYNSMLMRSPDYVMHFNRKEAMRMLYQNAGVKYPVDMVKTFISIMGIYPVGTMLLLSNGKTGIVVDVNRRNQACPKILMLDSKGKHTNEFIDLNVHKDIHILKELSDDEANINPMQIFTAYIYSRAEGK